MSRSVIFEGLSVSDLFARRVSSVFGNLKLYFFISIMTT